MLCSFHKNGPEIEFSEIAKIWLDKFRKMKYNNSRKSRHATVAQLVEQLIRNQQVAGSSPATSSIKQGAVAHPLKKKDRSKSQKRLYNFGLLL